MRKKLLKIAFFCLALSAALSMVAAAADITRADVGKWKLLHITEKYAAPEYLTKLADILPRTVNVTLSDGQKTEVSVAGAWTPETDNSRWTNSVNLSALPEGTADPQGILNELAITWSVDDYTGSFAADASPQFVGQSGAFNMWRYMSGTDIVELWQIPADNSGAALRATQNSGGYSEDGNSSKYDVSAWTAQDAGEWFALYYFSSQSYYGMGAYLAGSSVIAPKTYTVTFRPGGGVLEGPDTYQTVFANGAYRLQTVPPTPVRNNYRFDGWYTQSVGGEAVSVTTQTAFTADTTLYAQWTREGGSAPSSSTSEGKELRAVKAAGVPDAANSVDTGSNLYYSERMFANLYRNADGSFTTVDGNIGENALVTFWSGDFQRTGQKTIPMELPIFGAFLHGETYNYLLFGQENPDEDDNREVLRLVKYDHNFQRISSVSIRNCFTYTPFRSSSCRMAEAGNHLTIHTSRHRYLTDDNLRHQSQLTVVVNTDTMTVENDLGEFQSNHVSHSFNQFVLYDGDANVLLDHGDAYPRSIVVSQFHNNSYRTVDLLKIPGPIGENWTGVTVGGFAQSKDFYLATVKSIRQDKISYGEQKGSGYTLDSDERDVYLLSCSKYMDGGSVRQDALTNYYQTGVTAGIPYLVQVKENQYAILWQEFSKEKTQWGYDTYRALGVRYALVNGNADLLTDAVLLPNAQLSRYCQPIADGDNVIWYVDTGKSDERIFYRLSLSGEIENPEPTEPEIQSVQAADGLVTVTLGGELPADALLTVATYQPDGKFLNVNITDAVTGQVPVQIATEPGAIVRAFLTDKSCRPLCAPKAESVK